MSYPLATAIFAGSWLVLILIGRKFRWTTARQHIVGFVVGTIAACSALLFIPIASVSDRNPHAEDTKTEGSELGSAPVKVSAARNPIVNAQRSSEHRQVVRVALQTPESAYKLSNDLMECASLDRLVNEHDSLSERLNEQQMKAATEQLDALSVRCLPLIGMDDGTGYALARHAANAGLLDAQIYFPALAAPYITANENNMLDDTLIRQYKRDVVRFAEAAASTGDTYALYHAYTVYADGLFIDRNAKLAHYYLSEYLKKKPDPRLLEVLKQLSSE